MWDPGLRLGTHWDPGPGPGIHGARAGPGLFVRAWVPGPRSQARVQYTVFIYSIYVLP